MKRKYEIEKYSNKATTSARNLAGKVEKTGKTQDENLAGEENWKKGVKCQRVWSVAAAAVAYTDGCDGSGHIWPKEKVKVSIADHRKINFLKNSPL